MSRPAYERASETACAAGESRYALAARLRASGLAYDRIGATLGGSAQLARVYVYRARERGLDAGTLHVRTDYRGKPIVSIADIRAYAVNHTRPQIAEHFGIPYHSVFARCARHGIEPLRTVAKAKPVSRLPRPPLDPALAKPNGAWPLRLVHQMRLLWESGRSVGDLAAMFGVSKGAVVGLASRNGFTPRPSPIPEAARG